MTLAWQKCPVCNGTGLVSTPPNVAGDQPSFSTSESGPWVCRVCYGKAVIWGPTPTHLRDKAADARPVHNHGSEDGPGLACRERLVGGRLVGDCVATTADGVDVRDYMRDCRALIGEATERSYAMQDEPRAAASADAALMAKLAFHLGQLLDASSGERRDDERVTGGDAVQAGVGVPSPSECTDQLPIRSERRDEVTDEDDAEAVVSWHQAGIEVPARTLRERLHRVLADFAAKGRTQSQASSEKSEPSATEYKLLVRDLAAEMRGESAPTGRGPSDG